MWLVRSPLKSQEPSEAWTVRHMVLVVGPFVDPCHLREMPLTVRVDREERIAISHAGDVGRLIFEADISARRNRRACSLFCPQLRIRPDKGLPITREPDPEFSS